MDHFLFLSFLTATLIIVVTPGPSVALACAQAVRFGPRAAVTTVAGDALGTVLHILIATASLKTLISLAGSILPVLQIAGGCFVIWMAVKSLLAARAPSEAIPHTPPRATFWAGFFACATNPKAIVFFVALFPGFISAGHSIALQSLVYGAVFVALDAAFILGYALAAMHAFNRTLSPRLSIEALSGLGLFGVGALLVVKGYRALPEA
mgnify:CR=1 FL=1